MAIWTMAQFVELDEDPVVYTSAILAIVYSLCISGSTTIRVQDLDPKRQ